MTQSLITDQSHFALMAIMFIVVMVGMILERGRFGSALSAAMVALGGGFILSNLRVIPFSAPAYGFVMAYLVPVAIPLLLYKADIRRIISESGPTFLAFMLGAAGTFIGAYLAFHVFSLGAEGEKIAGTLMASYIGGSMNFVGVSQAVGLEDNTRLTAALAADSVVGFIYLFLLSTLATSAVLKRMYPPRLIEHVSPAASPADEKKADHGALDMQHIAAGLGLSLLICAVSYPLAAWLGFPQMGILFITALAVLVANIAPRQMDSLKGEFDLGLMFMYLFFFAIGAGANVYALIGSAAVLLAFVLFMCSIHLVVMFIGGKFLGLSHEEIIIGSNACVLGPPTAAAMAANQGWNHLVTPAVLVGVFGYVIANFLGVTLVNLIG
jgi:uncharacterized membrane protein